MVVCCHGNRYFNFVLVNSKDILLLYGRIEFQHHIFCSLGKIGTGSISPRISDQQLTSYDFRHYWGVYEVGKRRFQTGLRSSLNPHNSRMAWPIPVTQILFFSILKAHSYESNLYFACSSPLGILYLKLANYHGETI